MDISGLVLTGLGICFEVASTLYSYGIQVKGARRDIQNLSNELFGLIGALEHLKMQQEDQVNYEANPLRPPPYSEMGEDDQKRDDNDQLASIKKSHQENTALVLKQTVEFLQELQESLKVPKTRFGAAVQRLKWPLRESEVKEHLNRLERVKTYFVLSLVTDDLEESRKTASEISTLRVLIENVSLRQQAADSRNEHQTMMEWLCPVDPKITRKSIERTRMPGTGTWFLNSDELRMQSDSEESSCLWLNGITGAGKSTLLTAAIDELLIRHDGRYDFAYFYCSFSNADSLHTHSVLGSILAQICIDSDPVYLDLKSKFEELAKKSLSKGVKLEVDVLVSLIIQQAKHRKRICIAIDGINECSDPCELLMAFEKIVKSTPGVRILISSINEKKIEQSILRMPKIYELTVSPQKVESDVSILVHSALERQPRLRELPQSLKSEITTRLTDGAEGMFRWVQCQLDLLSKLRTPGSVRKALHSLPSTLDKTYENLLDRIDGEEDRALTRQILQMLAFSFRPLSLGEISTMLQITTGMRHMDESKCLTHPSDILDICGSLLKYNERTGQVTLAHHSVKTYLTSAPRNSASYFRLETQDSHRTLALACVTYLSFDAFAKENAPAISKPEENSPLDYATQYWGLHMKEVSDPDEVLWQNLRYFLLSAEDGRHNFNNWVRVLIPHSRFANRTSPLYYAASYGLTNTVKYLLEMGVDIEEHGGRGGATPINIAAFRGNLDVVKVLYEHGADPRKPDLSANLNAAQWAQIEGQWDVVDYFEAKGCGPKFFGPLTGFYGNARS